MWADSLGRLLIVWIALSSIAVRPGLAAQESASPNVDNDFGLWLSVTSYARREEVLNPLRHQGTFVSLGLFYERPRASSAARFDLDLVFNPVSSRYEDDKNSFASSLRLAYRRVRLAATPYPDLRLLAGGHVAFSTRLAYFDNWDDSHFYWLTSYAIGPTVTLEYARWEDRSLSLDVSVPMVALVSRPGWPIYKVANGDFVWIVGKLDEDMTLRPRAAERTEP